MTQSDKIYISILIPVYNSKNTIEKSLNSCINQNFDKNYEIVIVDDGSTDNTIDVITNGISKTNIPINIYHQEHLGISQALNKGLQLCKGDYILRMDGDDYMLPDRLTIQYDYITSHPKVDLLCNNIKRFYNGEEISTSEITNRFITKKDFNDIQYNFAVHPTFCFSKKLYYKIIDTFGYFYDSEYNGAEDYELLLRLLDNDYKIYIDDNIVLHYNVYNKTYDYQKLQQCLSNKLNYKYDIYNIENKHIGIYYIATGIYNKSFPDFLASLNNFFPNTKKTIILLSDQLNSYDNYCDDLHNIRIKYKHINHQPWPLVTLLKMNTILENKGNYDYVFYFNANSILLDTDYSWFNPNKLILTCHKDWIGEGCKTTTFLPAYHDNPNSVSYIGNEKYIYIQAAFFGGNAKLVYEMCESVSEMVIEDLINNIIPKWHDETYLNKYAYIHNYSRNNKMVIDNVLISEIFYDKNNLANLQSTQFILLKENIYNTEENNKADKFSKLIPPHYLHTLYNYEHIYDYKDKYPVADELNIKSLHTGKSLLCIYISQELTEEKFRYICDNIKYIDKRKYEIFIYFDSTNPFKERFVELEKTMNNLNVYLFDTMTIVSELASMHNRYNFIQHIYDLHMNILYLYGFTHIKNINMFDYLYIVHENDVEKLFNSVNTFDILNKNIDMDLIDITKDIIMMLPDDFNSHIFTKTYKLFKYKNRYKHLMLYHNSIYRLSCRAFMFLHNTHNILKTEPYIYAVPTLLYNNGFTISLQK